MRKYLSTVFMLARTLIIRWGRDPVALFFIFLFPLIFLLVFGTMFRGNNLTDFKVAIINRSDTQFAEDFESRLNDLEVFDVKESASFDDAKEKMGRGELSSIIELPAGFGAPNEQGLPSGKIATYFEESDPTAGQTVAGIIQQVLDGINKELVPTSDPLAVEQKATETTGLSRFDYTLSGIVGFSILSLAIFGMANGFPADKKTGALRRLRATPLKASQLIVATGLQYLLAGIVSVILMFAVAEILFDFDMRGNYITLLIFSTISTFSLFGFGMAIGGWAKNENQSAPLSNLIAMPMMFLSGVFFPVFLMPEWLQNVSQYLPLTPVVDGIRMIITENASLLDLGAQLGIITAWTVIIYAVAARFFRWE